MTKFLLIISLLLSSTLLAATPRIVGGGNTQAPGWMASLQRAYGAPPYVSFSHYCGASLIAPQWLVTAAHCVDELNVAQIRMMIGDSTLAQENILSSIDQVVIHPQWQPLNTASTRNLELFANDIALLHLSEPVSAPPVLLATPSQTQGLNSDASLTAYGWGAMDAAGLTAPEQLQSVTLPYLGKMLPQQLPDHLFAGSVAGENICFGDSGGPLVHKGVLYGISSFVTSTSSDTLACANPDAASGFTAIASHQEWLQSQQQGLTVTNRQSLAVHSGDEGSVTFVIRNYSKAPWLLGQITSSSPLDAACQQSTLQPGESCTIQVGYRANDPGVSETLRIDYSATSTLGSQDNSLWLTVQNIDAAAIPAVVPASPQQSSSGGGSCSLLALLGLWLMPRSRHLGKRQ